MKKKISEKELATISGGKTKVLTMGYTGNHIVKTIKNWFSHK